MLKPQARVILAVHLSQQFHMKNSGNLVSRKESSVAPPAGVWDGKRDNGAARPWLLVRRHNAPIAFGLVGLTSSSAR
jgi:hypothetical protein